MASFTIADASNPTNSSFTVDLPYQRVGSLSWSLNYAYPYDIALTHGETSGSWTLNYGLSNNQEVDIFGTSPANFWMCQGVNTSLTSALEDGDPFELILVGASGTVVSKNPADPQGMTWTRVA